jgi:uncharacterized protein (DUF2345 family)
MSDDPLDTTPAQMNFPEDARKKKGAGKYPNYYSHKTRSGHLLIFDDSKGAEHVTLQHRSGTTIQMHSDGAMVLTSSKGQYQVTFGPNRIEIKGAQDIHVTGDASLKVDGNYNMTVGKNMNMTVMGDLNMSAKNVNQTVRGNIDIQAKNRTEKIEGSSSTQSQGALGISAGDGIMIFSGDSLGIRASSQVGIQAMRGELMMKSAGKATLWSAGDDVAIEGSPNVWINSAKHDDVQKKFKQRKAKKPTPESS